MKLIHYILAFLLIINIANATYSQEFIIDNEVNVNILINFDNQEAFSFNLELPNDASNLKVLFDNQEKEFQIQNNIVSIYGSAKEIKINYNSDSYIEKAKKNYFTAEVNSLLNEDFGIKVTLPEGATLDKPFTKNLEETSVYPAADDITTNGKNLIITWNYDASTNEKFPLFVIYNESKFNYLYIIIPLIMIALVLSYLFKKRKKIVKIKKVKVDNIEKHLKEEEKLIVNILKQKQGECTQSTLVTLTNMSKASLSRLLNELESRNIIYKEKKGNKNIIILKRR